MDDGTQVQFLGGDQRKTLRQVKAHLPAEHAVGARAGAIRFRGALLKHVPEQVEIDTHQDFFPGTGSATTRGCSVGAEREASNRTTPSRISGSDRIWPMVSQPQAR